MRIEYRDNGKHAIFNGELFTRDDKTGYYLTSNNAAYPGRRLHRAVWEFYNGPIPDGHDIHHADHDKGNNDIENLICMERDEHRKLHCEEKSEETLIKQRANLSQIRELAAEWHKSDMGREWHKDHYERVKDRFYVKKTMVCEYCGCEYETVCHNENRFCSNKCKSAWRRKAGLDNVERICIICGGTFTVNKYAKTATCSNACAAALRKAHECIYKDKKVD